MIFQILWFEDCTSSGQHQGPRMSSGLHHLALRSVTGSCRMVAPGLLHSHKVEAEDPSWRRKWRATPLLILPRRSLSTPWITEPSRLPSPAARVGGTPRCGISLRGRPSAFFGLGVQMISQHSTATTHGWSFQLMDLWPRFSTGRALACHRPIVTRR